MVSAVQKTFLLTTGAQCSLSQDHMAGISLVQLQKADVVDANIPLRLKDEINEVRQQRGQPPTEFTDETIASTC